ncbi:type II toxin-antitoxin system VapC family toxin [Candidatus Woesearchaeota archaeon]|nr:type II toxin-antitoxin system VapC family toxin [Candidatus Woesearchaeota archaeon]
MTTAIDTDIFIDYLRGTEKANSFFKRLMQEKEHVIFSAITEAELLSAKECMEKEKADAITAFLSAFTKISVDNDIAKLGGALRREYGAALDDSLIAATAITRKARLATRNLSDYKKIPELEAESPYQ